MKDEGETEPQLTGELGSLRRRLAKLEESRAESERREEVGRQYSRHMAYLSRTALEFAAFPSGEDIYEHIAERLKEIVGDAIVFVSSFDEAPGTIQCRAVAGLGKLSHSVLKLIGRDPVGILFPISKEAYEGLRAGKLTKVPGGLHTLALGQIPKKACKAIEKLLGVGGIYAIGIAREGRLFGSASIVTRATGEPKNRTLIETFINQASVALQRKRAEEALLNAAQEWRTTFDTIGDAICLLDAEGKVVRCNKAMAGLLGKSFSEILGRPCHELVHGTSARVDDCPFVRMKRSRRREGLVLEMGEQWFDVAVDPLLDDADNVIGAVHIMADVTERRWAEAALRESESNYRTLVENLPQKVFLKDRHSVYVSCNENYAQDLKIAPAEIVGKTDYDFYPEELAGKYRTDDRRIMKSGETEDIEEAYVREGRRLCVHTVKTPVRNEQGNTVGVLGIFWDVTERRQAEEEKERLQAQLLQAQKMEAVGRLAGGIAHDFNNLMTIVTGYGELALKTLDEDDPLRKDIEEMKRAGERAARLTRQLLAFSRKQVIQPKVLDLNVVVAGTGKMLRRLIGEDIDLVTILEARPGVVEADPGQLEQVIMNLAVNARDAMPEGGKLTIETRDTELDEDYARGKLDVEPGSYVLLAMSDTGCGMDEETRSHVFEPFFTTKGEGKGTGLGLATTYGIVKQHNGHISVYSEPGHGTTVKVYLPRLEEAIEVTAPDAVPAGSPRGTETVLLVEDEDVVRAVASKILELQGYSVLGASDGEAALRVCQRYEGVIHLMITDVVMPGMSGRELAERVAVLHPGTKVLYMSGYTDDAIVHHGVLDAGTPFIGKPFAPDALARKVREVLDTKSGE